MDYPALLTPDDNNTIRVTFPDFPEAHTFGDTADEALVRAKDALATAIDAYIKDRRPIPRPSVREGASVVRLPALTCSKIQLYETMRQGKVKKADLAKLLHWHPPQVDRLIDVHHDSRLDQIEAAFSVMGKRLVFTVEDFERESVKKVLAHGHRPRRVTARRRPRPAAR
jgi:antitoxin HicB